MPVNTAGGAVRLRKVTTDLRRGEQLGIFRNVPIGVCSRCGERYYPGRVLEHLDEIAAHALDRAKVVRVPVFDYAQAG